MIIIGIVLSFVGLAYLCWLLFSLAVNAVPFLIGVAAGLAASNSGSGPIAAIVIGAAVGTFTLVIARLASTHMRSPLVRAALALLFAIPAAAAGYHAARGLAHIVVPAEAWRETIAVAGAVIVATTAFMRMWLSSPPDAVPGVAAGLTSTRLPAPQTRELSARRSSLRMTYPDRSL